MQQRPSVFDSYNRTQLLQTCAGADLVVKPDATREEMIAYLDGEDEPPLIADEDNVFHIWRHGLIAFLVEHWRELETQITCPARHLKDPVNPNLRPCFGCLDTKLLDCLVSNPEAIRLIESHKLVRKSKT